MPQTKLLNVLMCALLLAACSEEPGGDGGVQQGDGSTAGMDGSTPPGDGSTAGMDGSTPPGDGSTPPGDGAVGADGAVSGGPIECQGHLYLCGNALDDDGDGLADDRDPDCLGPCDNNEGGFFLNIPGGDSAPCKLDCYFDQDQGSGNDQCEWDHRCDPLEPDPDPACVCKPAPCASNEELINGCCVPTSAGCPPEQTDVCDAVCGPLVPNGCDCFGCCELPAGPDGALEYVFIGSVDELGMPTCSLSNLEGCHSCTPVDACLNDCGRCELCLGRGVEDLPDDCFPPTTPDGGTPVDAGPLPDGATPPPDGGTPPGPDVCSDPTRQDCGAPGLPACPDGFFCITGCCTHFG